ncbi:MAG: choice-of-anchor D domain-containing protein [Archangium sp.]|nr:choice-of-anchor D domain-containing protein [Archangium sp.]
MRQVLLVSLLSLGCQPGGLRPIAGELEVSSRSIDFGQVYTGTEVEQSVVLHNRSRGERRLSFSRTGPFSSVDGVQVLAGGSELTVQVRFAPAEPGEATGTLVISDASQMLEVTLVGIGVQVPPCSASGPCQRSVFDPTLGACVESLAADGTGCSNACTTSGLCSAGTCLGLSLDCSDTDLCTVDACDPSIGCIHPPQACAAPTNPCKAARCDPALGCVESDVRDGTSCGVADCTSAQVCLQGQCKVLPVPDGATCAEATPCQGEGTCQQGLCERPAATELAEAWHYDFPGLKFSFRGVTDALQNLYWLECPSAGACSATSYSRDGALRFRTPLGQVGLTASQLPYLLAGDELISANGSVIEAVASSDGAPRWSYTLPAALPGAPDQADVQVIAAMAADQTGLTLIVRRALGQQEARQSLVLKLDLGTRATVFSHFHDALVDGVVSDESSNLYFTLIPWYRQAVPTRPNSLVSLRATGVERWRWVAPAATPAAVARPIAVFNGEVILEGGEVRATQDGSVRASAPAGDVQDHPLMGPSARMLVRRPPSNDRLEVIAMDRGVATPAWEALVTTLHGSNAITDTVATLGGGVLVASGGSRQPNVLKSFSSLGVERFACVIPGNVPGGAMVHQPVAMLDGRWAVVESRYLMPAQLRVFEVPGELRATRGWLGRNGSPSGCPRPVP